MANTIDELRDLARSMRKVASDLETGGDTEDLINAYVRRFIYLNPRIAVIGPEGAGKSTLVNTLLGAPYAPTHASRPATAAPIAFRRSPTDKQRWLLRTVHGAEHEMMYEQALPLVVQFEVETASDPSATPRENSTDRSRERKRTFWSLLAFPFVLLFKIVFFPFFIFRRKRRESRPVAPRQLALPPPAVKLQRQDIALAIADVPSPWLDNGVWLLDLPGVEGADVVFSGRPPPLGLLDGAMTILVVRGRGMGPGVRLAAQLAKQHTRIGATIINVTRDDIDDDASVSDVEGYKEAFAEACASNKTEQPTSVYVANLRHFDLGQPIAPGTLALTEHHQRLRTWLDSVFQSAAASQLNDIVETGKRTERALREHAVKRGQLLAAFTGDASRSVSSAAPDLASAIAVAFAQFEDIFAPALAQITAAVNAMSAARMSALGNYVGGLRSEATNQRFVVALHFKGWRERAHGREAEEIAAIRTKFAEEAQAVIPLVRKRLADRICQQVKHRTWPINQAAVMDYLSRASVVVDAKYVAPALPALDANLSGWNAVNARAPILSGFSQYLGFCDASYYARIQSMPLADAISTFRDGLRQKLETVLTNWIVGDQAVRRAVGEELGILSSAEKELDKVRTQLGTVRVTR